MGCELIGPRKLDYYINNPYAVIIDIRTKQSYNKGHIQGAINMPYDMFNTFGGYTKFQKNYSNKRLIYVFYCDKGTNSMIVCNKLSAMGYMTKSLVGGFEGYKGKHIIY